MNRLAARLKSCPFKAGDLSQAGIPRGLLFGGLLEGFFSGGFAAADLFLRVHGATAFFSAAVAAGLIVAAVVEAVVVGDLLSSGDVLYGRYPDAIILFAGLAVGVATVVDEHGGAVAVDDHRAVAESKEVGDGRGLVGDVGFVLAEAVAGVLGDALTLADGRGGVAAGGVDGGGADDQCHANVRCFLWSGMNGIVSVNSGQ